MSWMTCMARKRNWFLLLLAVGMVATYFYFVFMATFSKSKGWTAYIKPGQSLPEMSNETSKECAAIFSQTTLTPHFDANAPHIRHDFPEFREYASVWLLDSASTAMYESALLNHPACLSFLLKRMSIVKNRDILVIYDRATNAEVLVIRNYQ